MRVLFITLIISLCVSDIKLKTNLHYKNNLEYNVIAVGQANTASADDYARFVLPANKELNMIVNMDHIKFDASRVPKWSGEEGEDRTFMKWKMTVDRWQRFRWEEGYWNRFVRPSPNVFSIALFPCFGSIEKLYSVYSTRTMTMQDRFRVSGWTPRSGEVSARSSSLCSRSRSVEQSLYSRARRLG